MGKVEYLEFLRTKENSAVESGFDADDLNPKLFEYEHDIVRWALKKGKAAIFAECGMGKGQPYGSKVLTPDGWKEIQDLRIGDSVVASDGNAYSVTGVYPKGEIDTYRFNYSDGESCVFDKDHLHFVRTNNSRCRGKGFEVVSTTDLIERGNIRYGKDGKSRNYDIPVVKPIRFAEKSFLIKPYTLGVLIGDGGLTCGNVSLSNPDSEVVERVLKESEDLATLSQRERPYDYIFITGPTGNKRSQFRSELLKLGLLGKYSYEKHIPRSYLFSSIEQRVDLLRGLMDTDGYIATCGTCSFYTTSKLLSEDVVFLIRSLGGIPTVNHKRGKYKKSDGTVKECRLCYIVTFSLKTFNPFYLSRKAERYNPNPRDNGRWISSISYEKKQRTVCISVDSPDHSYVTENFVVTHNTIQQLSWAEKVVDHTGKSVLIVAPLSVAHQTVREGEKFGIKATYAPDGSAVTDTGLYTTNYERLNGFDASKFSGVVLDESSILKDYTSSTKQALTDMFKDTPYKLCCTATPSPNDYVELGNHAEFLGIMSRTEMLATYFVHDGGETQKWRLKGHAQQAFFAWVASWACCMTHPSDLGYEMIGFNLPELRLHEIEVKTGTIEAEDGQFGLFPQVSMSLMERRKARRDSLTSRAQKAVEIALSEDTPCLLWCDLNSEQDDLERLLGDRAFSVRGATPSDLKVEYERRWREGERKILISKPSVFGYGMNWQHCSREIFVGLSDSFEAYYQAVRRCWRFGQTRPVDVYIVISEAEGAVKANIERKQADAIRLTQELVKYTKDILQSDVRHTTRITETYFTNERMDIPTWMQPA